MGNRLDPASHVVPSSWSIPQLRSAAHSSVRAAEEAPSSKDCWIVGALHSRASSAKRRGWNATIVAGEVLTERLRLPTTPSRCRSLTSRRAGQVVANADPNRNSLIVIDTRDERRPARSRTGWWTRSWPMPRARSMCSRSEIR